MRSLIVLSFLIAIEARADEGLFPFDAFPKEKVAAATGVAVTDARLAKMQRATLDLGACSGTFVSPNGLLLTTQACVSGCLDAQSVKRRNEARFAALCRVQALRKGLPLFDLLYCSPLDRDEAKDFSKSGLVDVSEPLSCPSQYADQLLSTTDITEAYNAETHGSEAAAREVKRKMAATCEGKDAKTYCAVRERNHGLQVVLEKYRRFTDVRVAFAAERSVARFGEPDEAQTFPRYAFPAAFLRVYEDDKPIASPDYLPLSGNSLAAGDMVFVSGTPSQSLRHEGAHTLRFRRAMANLNVELVGEIGASLSAYADQHNKPMVNEWLTVLSKAHAYRRDEVRALNSALLEARDEADERVRAKLAANKPREAERFQNLLHNAADTVASLERFIFEGGSFFEISDIGTLFQIAKWFARYASEQKKPNKERLEGFGDNELAQTRAALTAPLHYDAGVEILLLRWLLTKTRDDLGPNNPFTKKVLGREDPRVVAARLVNATNLGEVHLRQQLFDGGAAAIEASTDPMLVFARSIDGDGQKMRQYLEHVEQQSTENEKALAVLRAEAGFVSAYPEGEGTLRLRFGHVRGYERNGEPVQAIASLAGLYGYATSREPYVLPQRWLDAKEEVDLSTPLSFVVDADTVIQQGYGDVGSAVISGSGELVGVTFAGNENTAAARYAYDEKKTRAVALSSVSILHVLKKVYRADALVTELSHGASASRQSIPRQ